MVNIWPNQMVGSAFLKLEGDLACSLSIELLGNSCAGMIQCWILSGQKANAVSIDGLNGPMSLPNVVMLNGASFYILSIIMRQLDQEQYQSFLGHTSSC